MNKLLLSIFGLALLASANQRAQGWCEAGNVGVQVGGVPSANVVQGSFPACLVTVNIHGGGLTTIYSDNSLTPLANPFHGSTAGIWFFYAANNHYDVTLCSDVLANNTCNGPLAAFTIFDILLDDPASGPSTVSSVTGSGSGISVSPNTGSVVVANTGVTGLVAGTGIGVSGATGNITVSATSAVPSIGSQTQFLRVQPNISIPTLQFASFQQATATDYNWPAQTPGGSLSTGANTITLSPMPLGVTSSFIGNYVYISNGTGTAEAALVTGWTSSTIIVTCGNSHTGAWTIQSATGGGAEAVIAGFTSVYFPSKNPATFYASLVIPGNQMIQFAGDSFWSPAIIRGSANTTADLFYDPGSGGELSFFNLNFNNGPGQTGRAIHVVSNALQMNTVYCLEGIFVDQDSTGISQLSNLQYYTHGSPTAFFIYRGTTNNAGCASARMSNVQMEGASTGYGIEVTGIDFLSIDNVLIDGPGIGLFMKPAIGGSYISTVYVTNSQFDAGSSSTNANEGIELQATVGASGIGNVLISNNEFNGEANLHTTFAVNIGDSIPGVITNIRLENNFFWEWGYSAIVSNQTAAAGDATIVINGNTMFANNQRGLVTNGGNILLADPQGVSITSNRIDATTGYGIYVLGTVQSSNLLIADNTLIENTLGPIFLDGALLATDILKNNLGITDPIPAIPSAATFPFPLSPNFTITGTTPMTAANTANIAPGSTGTFRCTGGSPTIAASGEWGNAGTCTVNVLFNWIFDGTNVWWK